MSQFIVATLSGEMWEELHDDICVLEVSEKVYAEMLDEGVYPKHLEDHDILSSHSVLELLERAVGAEVSL